MTVACLLLSAVSGWAQGFRTQGLLLDDDAGSLGTRNAITLLAPSDGNLTADYSLRFPDQTNLGVGSIMFVSATGTSADLAWLAAATDGDVMQLQGGVPTWQTLELNSYRYCR